MKEHLERELFKVETMKDDIKKPGNSWRKVAGELLASELETTIEMDIKKSQSMSVGHWDIGDLGAGKIQAL